MLFALIIRGGSVLSSFISTSLIISILGLNLSGEYFSSVAISLVLSTIYSFGINNSVIKYSKRIKADDLTKIFFFFKNVLFSMVPLVILTLFLFLFVFDYNVLVIFMGVTFAFAQMLQIYLVSIALVNVSYFLFNIVPQIIIVFCLWIEKKDILFYYIFSYFISFILMLYIINKNNKEYQNVIDDNDSIHEDILLPLRERFDFFQQDILGQMFTSISTIVISNFLSNRDVAIFNIYQKLGSVCNVIISVLNQIHLSVAIDYLEKKKYLSILKLRNKIFILSLLLISLYVLGVSLCWVWILSIFDTSDLSIYLFIMISVGYLFVAKANLLPYLLNSIGYSSSLRNYSYFTCISGIIILSILSSFFGINGSIFAIVFMLSIQSILLLLKYKREITL